MNTFGISKTKDDDLKKRMRQLKISERDLRESFIRSSGPGGQNVNKVSTCVVLVHADSGVTVKYQKERTQGLNRYKARCLLLDKIQKKRNDIRKREIQKREKLRRQKRKRSARTKEEMLMSKRKRSEKKSGRKKIRSHKLDQYL